MSIWAQTHLQDGSNPLSFYLNSFHDFSLVIMTMVTLYATMSVFSALHKSVPINKGLQANHVLEFIWTFMPVMVLMTVAIPSLALLFMLEDTSKESMPVKVIGSQWYWTYEKANAQKEHMPYSFDTTVNECYMMPRDAEDPYMYRLLDTSQKLELNSAMNYTFMITSSDVIHSWAIPALGIKMDACPGRLNYSFLAFATLQAGEYFGQCSEICGSNHSFMPISISVAWDQMKAAQEMIETNPKIYFLVSEYFLSMSSFVTSQTTNFITYLMTKTASI